jgi:tetratricopeptide (TPR) repeat protein
LSKVHKQRRKLYPTVSAAGRQSAEKLFDLGLLAYQSGQHETAISHFRRVLRLNPTHTGTYINLGLAFAAQGKIVEAVVHYERALALDPNHADAHNNLGVALVAQGRFVEAIAHYQRAIELDPRKADQHNNLGLALAAQGRIAEAICSLQQVIALNPNHAIAHNNLGVALADQGRVVEAITHCRRAIELKPGYDSAYNNLGVALSALGRFSDAMAAYQQALRINPNYTNAHANLAAALTDQGQLAAAALHIKQALTLNPSHAEAHNTQGKILANQGKFDQALEHFGRAIAIKPECAEAHLNRSQVKTFHPGDNDLATLEELAASGHLSPKKAVFIHFAIAKALDDTGDYLRAFEHWRKGNTLKRAQIYYDEAAVLRQFQRIRSVFRHDIFDRFRGAGDPSSVPVFILGMPRSGSSLIEQILASHPQVHGAGELTDFEMVAGSILQPAKSPVSYPDCVPTLDPTTFQRIGQAYLNRLTALSDGKLRIIDKLPGNFLNIGLIRLALPNARIIHTMRHPVATCLSCYSKLFVAGNHYSFDLAELGRFYRQYRQLMAHWHSVLPPQTILDVSYEDVVADLEGQARRLIEYCGLPWDDRCLSFHKTSRAVRTASLLQVRQPLFRGSLERWRNYESELAPLLDELMPNELMPGELPASYAIQGNMPEVNQVPAL